MSIPNGRNWLKRLGLALVTVLSLTAVTAVSKPADARVWVGFNVGVPWPGYYYGPAFYPAYYYGPRPFYRPYYRAYGWGWRHHHWCRWHPYRCGWF